MRQNISNVKIQLCRIYLTWLLTEYYIFPLPDIYRDIISWMRFSICMNNCYRMTEKENDQDVWLVGF